MKQKKSILDVLYEEPGPKTRAKIKQYTILSIILLLTLMILVIRQFIATGQLSARYWDFFARPTTWLFLLKGLLGTVQIAVIGSFIAFVAGFVFMFGRVRGNKIVNKICAAIIEFSRGVPTLLFIYFFFFVMPMFGIKITAFWKIAIPVAISASGSVAEFLRSGVNAVNKGQKEAALSLGFSENRTFFKILFPQGFKFVLPSLISQFVIVLKDSTFAYIVSYNDLMQNSMVLISNYDALLSVYLVTAVIYIVINYLLNKFSLSLAKKLGSKK